MHLTLGLGTIYQAIKNITLAIPKAIEDYKFRKFFGKDACQKGNVFLVLDPHENITPLTPVTQHRYRKKFHGRRADVIFPGADPVIGTGAIRATNYASMEAARHLPVELALKVKLDADLLNSWDGTFICYGSSTSNVKTYDIEHLQEMNLYTVGTTERHGVQYPCWRMNGHDYTVTKNDSAILMRIRNSRSEGNYLFVCAGLGEWGSSGSIRYLFRNWKTLNSKYRNGQNFCIVLDVAVGSDESAKEVAAYAP